jgi:wyosine [tRNA(Phe)-imidazoG37] synthetase (radical SAM superfamily)
VLEKEAELEKQIIEERSQLRQSYIAKHKHVIAENTRKTDEMTEKWKATQEVKKNRQIRDLQYELTVSRIEELQKVRQTQIHQYQETKGINDFERNMKKLGIAGGSSGEGGMTISYETREAYEARMQRLALKQMPTNEEVNNFKTQLKERTAANRLARYEKARRRRRALVPSEDTGDSAAKTDSH